MPVNLTSVKNSARALNVPLGTDGSINLSYYPNRYTPELFEKAREMTQDGELHDGIGITAYVFEQVIKEWDVVVAGKNGDDEALAITYNNVMSLPLKWLKEIDTAIEADLNPTQRSGKNR